MTFRRHALRTMPRVIAFWLLSAALVAATAAVPPPQLLPDDAGVANVRDYGAVGDGVADDTAALQKAMTENLDMFARLIYLPPGTYRISGTLGSIRKDGSWWHGVRLIGAGPQHTIIRLADGAPGFADTAKPKPMIKLTTKQEDGSAMGHKNSVMNLTIDAGQRNPGAIAIDWTANNTGALRDLVIRGTTGGTCGISMERKWPGPCLIKDVTVEGFDHGMRVAFREHPIVMEGVTLVGQRIAGIRNEGNVLCMRRIASRNRVPAIDLVDAGWTKAMLVLLDSDFSDGGGGPAIASSAAMIYLRNCRADGYTGLARGAPAQVAEWSSEPAVTAFAGTPEAGSLKIPIEETPTIAHDDPRRWSRAGGRDSGSIQAAIDRGQPVVYLPFGQYDIRETIVIRGPVRRILGCASMLNCRLPAGQPLFAFQGTAPCAIDFIRIIGPAPIVHDSTQPLAVRHCEGGAARNTARGTGGLFIEDWVCEPMEISPGGRVYARQLNMENPEWNVRNEGGVFWALGLKTERASVVVRTTKGGASEVLGGLIYPVHPVPKDWPMFDIVDAAFSCLVRYSVYDRPNYANLNRIRVREVRGGQTQLIENDNRIQDRLFIGYQGRPAVLEARTAAKPAGRATATAKPETPQPSPPPQIDAAVRASWDARLQAALAAAAPTRRPARLLDRRVGGAADVAELRPGPPMQVVLRSGGMSIEVAWKLLEPEALSGAAESLGPSPANLVMAAFYARLAGDAGRAERLLLTVPVELRASYHDAFEP